MCCVEGILEEDVVGFGRMGVCKFWMGEAVWACALWRESGGENLGWQTMLAGYGRRLTHFGHRELL